MGITEEPGQLELAATNAPEGHALHSRDPRPGIPADKLVQRPIRHRTLVFTHRAMQYTAAGAAALFRFRFSTSTGMGHIFDLHP